MREMSLQHLDVHEVYHKQRPRSVFYVCKKCQQDFRNDHAEEYFREHKRKQEKVKSFRTRKKQHRIKTAKDILTHLVSQIMTIDRGRQRENAKEVG